MSSSLFSISNVSICALIAAGLIWGCIGSWRSIASCSLIWSQFTKLFCSRCGERHSLAKCPILPQLKQGPFGLVGGPWVWATFAPNGHLLNLFGGARVRAEVSIGTGWFLIQQGALLELYWFCWGPWLGLNGGRKPCLCPKVGKGRGALGVPLFALRTSTICLALVALIAHHLTSS